ncbi:hypothetical protein Sango_1887400 [Sesamum angolense]|uniref:Transposase n=1 Tax=Sesamum angolense TaxID=2727404 RepID=A0AAE1WIX4_9LAMI|nr:hypothetical protein Sango_1887400 [Sesamum angolense]
MDRNAFGHLCYILQESGWVKETKNVIAPEQVVMFLSILSHHKKNCVVKHDFMRSSRTVSKHFHAVLHAVYKLHTVLLAKPIPTTEDCLKLSWKWFMVPLHEKGRYRTRKGQIAVNVLSVCNPNMQFIYALSSWEESAANSHVLCDAIHRDDGLHVPSSNYYLCENGYENAEGFLMPYRGVRYHLRKWDHGTGGPQNKEELFNLKHSSARNVKEDVQPAESNIKAEPPITSKLHLWKKQYSTLMIIMTKSGLGWDESHHMETVEDNKAWDEFVKIDPFGKRMRYNSWPLFPAWCEIFRKDRATRERAGFHGLDEEQPQSYNMNCDPTVNSSVTKRTTSSRKCKVKDASTETPQLVNMVSNFYETTNNRIRSLTRALESEFGDPDKHGVVMQAVREISGLDENDILIVTKLVHEPKNMEIFFSLSMESRRKWYALYLLAGLKDSDYLC